MKRVTAITAALLIVAVAIPALAGEHKKCEMEAEACLREYAAKLKNRGWVGIEMEHREDGSLEITRVVSNSPAERAGFQAGDVLASVNGVAYSEENKAEMKKIYKSFQPGNTVTYKVKRDGEKLKLDVELSAIPETVMAQWIGQHMLMAHMDQPSDETS
jgi:predicted metalloprotease with PDZ domain